MQARTNYVLAELSGVYHAATMAEKKLPLRHEGRPYAIAARWIGWTAILTRKNFRPDTDEPAFCAGLKEALACATTQLNLAIDKIDEIPIEHCLQRGNSSLLTSAELITSLVITKVVQKSLALMASIAASEATKSLVGILVDAVQTILWDYTQESDPAAKGDLQLALKRLQIDLGEAKDRMLLQAIASESGASRPDK